MLICATDHLWNKNHLCLCQVQQIPALNHKFKMASLYNHAKEIFSLNYPGVLGSATLLALVNALLR